MFEYTNFKEEFIEYKCLTCNKNSQRSLKKIERDDF